MKAFPLGLRSARPLISVFVLLTFGIGPLIAGEPFLPTATPTPASIGNISTRLRCETKEKAIVTEFAVQGTGTKYVILRALGPSLRGFGIPEILRDPTLTLLDADGNVLDFNDNWIESPDKEAIIATGVAPGDDHEPAIVRTLSPGVYTSVVEGFRNRTGTAIPELYDLEFGNPANSLSAVGARGDVLIGDNVLISGSILIGNAPVTLLLRVLGPSLTTAGLSGVLADPYLELHNGDGSLIASNDNWIESPDKDAIIASGYAPDRSREPAILVTLNPGAYTAVVSGVNGTTGMAFYQAYSLAGPGPELSPAPIIHVRH